MDHFGRRPLQIIGALVMAVSMISLGTDFWLGGKGMVALVCMLVYTAGFAVSWGPVTWVLLSEIFPNQIRGKAMALAVAMQWIANYLVSWTFPILDKNPYLVDHFKHGFAYWIYGVMGILAALFMAGIGAGNQRPYTRADGSAVAGARQEISPDNIKRAFCRRAEKTAHKGSSPPRRSRTLPLGFYGRLLYLDLSPHEPAALARSAFRAHNAFHVDHLGLLVQLARHLHCLAFVRPGALGVVKPVNHS